MPLQRLFKTNTIVPKHVANSIECSGETTANSGEYSRKKMIPMHIQDVSKNMFYYFM